MGAPADTIWTAERIDELRGYQAQGLLPADIAPLMGLSKQSVIGKWFRLGFSVPKAVRMAARRLALTPRQWRNKKQRVAKIPLYDGWRAPRQSPTNGSRAAVRRSAIPLAPSMNDLPAEAAAAPVNIVGLLPHHCRWPISGDGAAMLYCGAARHEPFSYCPAHCRAAFRARG
jgi:hypothetical protein